MSATAAPTVALLYPGDRAARNRADPAASRFAALFQALAAAGVQAQPAVWHDDFADEVAAQLRGVQAVLVWCNPIEPAAAATGSMRCFATWRAGACWSARTPTPS